MTRKCCLWVFCGSGDSFNQYTKNCTIFVFWLYFAFFYCEQLKELWKWQMHKQNILHMPVILQWTKVLLLRGFSHAFLNIFYRFHSWTMDNKVPLGNANTSHEVTVKIKLFITVCGTRTCSINCMCCTILFLYSTTPKTVFLFNNQFFSLFI